jgi:spheroidene monooxygenase
MFGTSVFRAYRDHADEAMTIFLTPASARGKWAGTEPFTPQDVDLDGPIAALTRATVKPSVALKFWGQEPAISRAIGADPNVMFKIGIGEVPWMQQVTFSIWPDAKSMAGFARADGPHARAIKAVRDGGWFKRRALRPLPRRRGRRAMGGRHTGPDAPPGTTRADPIEVAAE